MCRCSTSAETRPSPAHTQVVTLDLSFISVLAVLPAVAALMAPSAQLVSLIKPQFEARREEVAEGFAAPSTLLMWLACGCTAAAAPGRRAPGCTCGQKDVQPRGFRPVLSSNVKCSFMAKFPRNCWAPFRASHCMSLVADIFPST